ncbi:hypothetical protein PTKIN_Ptkin06aG0179200 [Pterospermum kingtungense]
MDTSHSRLLFLLLIHGLVLQTCHASRKLPLMVQAPDIHDMDTVEAYESIKVTKLFAQRKVEIVRRTGKELPVRHPSPTPNQTGFLSVPPPVTPPYNS